jgi:hypothetical protein
MIPVPATEAFKYIDHFQLIDLGHCPIFLLVEAL